MKQTPSSDSHLLFWAGDYLHIELKLDSPRSGRAVFRCNVGSARAHRAEIIRNTETGAPVLCHDWHDIPMVEREPGCFAADIALTEVGVFSGKACFFPDGATDPEWPEGGNLSIKVEPAHTASGNTMYTAFVRLFGDAPAHTRRSGETSDAERCLDSQGYTVIPPSGTFRDLIRRLDVIMDRMGFRIVQLLPIHPTPSVYARMGRYGSPFASLDFLSVNPELAEFDTKATPLDQFRELGDAVHGRGGYLYIDLPANHTGWASTLQIHHRNWFKSAPDGSIISPGAWGVTWEDLAELDYSSAELRAYMAEVFLFWCRNGVDGFRCDAGYMIPVETWRYIVARVREEFPDTVFMLEGLGGPVETTRRLLEEAGLNWAYSEIFQTYDRAAMDAYLPGAISLSQACGPLIHFAETHDNNRLAASGETFAGMRVAMCALLSHQGAFGISNGVEWFADEKIDVHGRSSLNWGAERNMVEMLRRLNHLLLVHPAFGPHTRLEMVTRSHGPAFAVLRRTPCRGNDLLVLVNTDTCNSADVAWDASAFPADEALQVLFGRDDTGRFVPGAGHCCLSPGEVLCLGLRQAAVDFPDPLPARRSALAMLRAGTKDSPWAITEIRWPEEATRAIPLPAGNSVRIRAAFPFAMRLVDSAGATLAVERSFPAGEPGVHLVLLPKPGKKTQKTGRCTLQMTVFSPSGAERREGHLELLPARMAHRFVPDATAESLAVLSNGAGAMSYVHRAWGTLDSQYNCLLAVNCDKAVPVDKTVFWTRCRAWVRRQGFSCAVDASCLTGFEADPAGRAAVWHFKVPCGMGKWVPLTFRLELAEMRNAVRFSCRRSAAGGDALGGDVPVTLILRPDVEWRSFHTVTKAYAGSESHFPKSTVALPGGFEFAPGGVRLAMRCGSGAFTMEPEWTYNVHHRIEAERGLEANGDLFSPGWFSVSLVAGQCETVTAGVAEEFRGARFPDADLSSETGDFADTMRCGISAFVVRRDHLKTVIAGYPWFLDWGRDTLIVLRGMIAAGLEEQGAAIIREFGRFEERGTLPNIIHGNTVGNRDTSDAPLLYCLAVVDLARVRPSIWREKTEGTRTVEDVVRSIVDNIALGTPNGVKEDAASGLVYSPPHFTWMDTNYPACSPREGYPVEIQALWAKALDTAAERFGGNYAAKAALTRSSIVRLFKMADGGYADCLRAKAGVPAAEATMEDAVRPNMLFLATLGIVGREEAAEILKSCECLLIPGAIRSLASRRTECDMGVWHNGRLLNDPHYPYRGMYCGDEDTMRKPAYHNGTAWTWPFPMYAEAMVEVYGGKAKSTAQSLMLSAQSLAEDGCIGHLPEILDGDYPHRQRGCMAQAWGVSEWVRVWRKLEDL